MCRGSSWHGGTRKGHPAPAAHFLIRLRLKQGQGKCRLRFPMQALHSWDQLAIGGWQLMPRHIAALKGREANQTFEALCLKVTLLSSPAGRRGLTTPREV